MRETLNIILGYLFVLGVFASLVVAVYMARPYKPYICHNTDSTSIYVTQGLEDNLYIIDGASGSIFFRTSCKEIK